ncbi:hypothetical protein Cni_G13680 [Canna indica]|uniref:Uncharacterized protein n=1 Tax=Canna indica TaxID=4628 RepID=A0AAQ3KAA6_9LILI|nr:hypothetical protein Cni_G13680 [Canna indica]
MVAERVITVEYMEPSMSLELLGKFPDSSAFDFDYSQSGIWSPLLPRHHLPPSLLCSQVRKKLLAGSPVTLRKVKGKFTSKKKKQQQRQSAMRKKLEFSPIPSTKIFDLELSGMEAGVESGDAALQSSWKIAAADDAANLVSGEMVCRSN